MLLVVALKGLILLSSVPGADCANAVAALNRAQAFATDEESAAHPDHQLVYEALDRAFREVRRACGE